jgi:putative nucleotidyltransferase with HDIG domain
MMGANSLWCGSAPDPSLGGITVSTQEFLRGLPALPAAAGRILGLMGKPDVDIKHLSSIISSDAVLAVEILRIANSAAFGLRNEVRTILQAIAILGTERVKGLAATVALHNFLGNVLQVPVLKRCWRHNTATAIVANEIAGWALTDGSEAYTLGILHDIGRMALIARNPAQYIALLDHAACQNLPLCEAETGQYGFDHAECGFWLARMWGLPAKIAQVIQDHHKPAAAEKDSPSHMIHYACRIAESLGFGVLESQADPGDPVAEFIGQLPEPLRKRLNIDRAELQVLIASQINAMEA